MKVQDKGIKCSETTHQQMREIIAHFHGQPQGEIKTNNKKAIVESLVDNFHKQFVKVK